MPVCLNHTDRQSTAKCSTCFKPICYECVVRRGRSVYCSQRCVEAHGRKMGGLSRSASRERALQRRTFLIRAAIVLVVAAVAIAACLLLIRHPTGAPRP